MYDRTHVFTHILQKIKKYVPTDYKYVDEDGESVNIGFWIQHQLQKWRDGKLPKHHYEMLTTIIDATRFIAYQSYEDE